MFVETFGVCRAMNVRLPARLLLNLGSCALCYGPVTVPSHLPVRLLSQQSSSIITINDQRSK